MAAAAVAVATAVLWWPRPASALAISAPSGPVSIGTVSTTAGGAVISAQLGPVTASDNGIIILLGSFDATVSINATSFTTGSGSSYETIPRASVKYWSGNATSHSGSCTAGQPTAAQAVDLTQTRPAYSCGGLLTVSATWNPTIVITLPNPLIAGTYTATITHSAA